MARVRRYIGTDVLTEAKARLHHIFDIFDSVAVMFSGGKDSLTALHLTQEVRQERGLAGPVDVVFRDEEVIPDVVIDFVDGYRRLPWVRMTWFTVPLASTKYILGVCRSYVQWDPHREWVRPKPPWSESLPAGDDRVFDQYTMDAYTARRFRGKIAFVTGIRAAESLIRYRSSVNKLNENYITAAADGVTNVQLCKPLFDWEENDIFRFFYDRGISYCPIYDAQIWAGQTLRVSTPLHAEAAKKFDKIRSQTPEFYERLITVFPEMLAHERYYRDLDRSAVAARHGETYEGVLAWIEENMAEDLPKARSRFVDVMKRARHSPAAYPPPHLLRAFMSGAYKRKILPMGRSEQARAD